MDKICIFNTESKNFIKTSSNSEGKIGGTLVGVEEATQYKSYIDAYHDMVEIIPDEQYHSLYQIVKVKFEYEVMSPVAATLSKMDKDEFARIHYIMTAISAFGKEYVKLEELKFYVKSYDKISKNGGCSNADQFDIEIKREFIRRLNNDD